MSFLINKLETGDYLSIFDNYEEDKKILIDVAITNLLSNNACKNINKIRSLEKISINIFISQDSSKNELTTHLKYKKDVDISKSTMNKISKNNDLLYNTAYELLDFIKFIPKLSPENEYIDINIKENIYKEINSKYSMFYLKEFYELSSIINKNKSHAILNLIYQIEKKYNNSLIYMENKKIETDSLELKEDKLFKDLLYLINSLELLNNINEKKILNLENIKNSQFYFIYNPKKDEEKYMEKIYILKEKDMLFDSFNLPSQKQMKKRF